MSKKSDMDEAANHFLNHDLGIMGWANPGMAVEQARYHYAAYEEAYKANSDTELVTLALRAGCHVEAVLLAAKDRDALKPLRTYSWVKK